jgi:bacteriocin-like protein
MAKPELKPEHLDKVEEVSEEELQSITGGKSVMPASKLQGYRLLKISETVMPTNINVTTKAGS